jgi:putative CocE/NonD family hydrolase
MLQDFAALRDAGHDARLMIGPWTHTAPGLTSAGIREGVGWLRARLLDDERLLQGAAVRLYVTGERTAGGWREVQAWPPPGTGERWLWLADNGRLKDQPSSAGAAADRYRYEPRYPTPSLGGPVLLARDPVVDNRSLEARSDVLTYTTTALPSVIEAIGPVRVELWMRASEPHFDVFARVCDVDASGASWNVCDALVRVAPGRYEQFAEGAWLVAFDLWPTAHRFDAGHRIRLQVSSGAYPRYARNPGTGEDPVAATTLRAVDIELLHDKGHPSALILSR